MRTSWENSPTPQAARSFTTTTTFSAGLKLIATQPEYIYVLGFAPVELKFNGSYHTLKVTLKNGAKLQLQARRGYFERQHLQNADGAGAGRTEGRVLLAR